MDEIQRDEEEKGDERVRLLSSDGGFTYGTLKHRSSSPAHRQHGFTIIEPVMVLFIVAKALADTVVTNMIEYRTCKTQMGFSDINCTEPIAPSVEDLIQPTTAHVIMARSIIEAFLPSCLALLAGPWSDINGRKPMLTLSLAGMTVTYLSWGCLALLPDMYPHYFLLCSLPLSFTGGTCAVFLSVYCYVTDVTDEHTRPLRFAILNLAITASAIFGVVAAPYLVELQQPSLNPYPLVFFLSAGLLVLATLFTLWGVRETVDVQPERERRLFLWSHVTSLVSVCLKRRDGDARGIVLLIITTLALSVFVTEGEGAIAYLSVREMFSWQLADYSRFISFNSVVSGLGTLVGVWFTSNLLQMSNLYAAALVLSTRYARAVIMAMANSSRHFYVSVIVSFMFPAYSPLCRTELSRLVSRCDLGKVFALIAFLESLSPIAASPLYTFIYEATYLQNPSAVYWLSAVVYLLCVFNVTFGGVLQSYANEDCYKRAETSTDKQN